MKKKLLYLLFALFISFTSFIVVKAQTYSFEYVGEQQNYMLYRSRRTLACPSTSDGGHISVEKIDAGVGYGTYKFTYSSKVDQDTSESLTCTWDNDGVQGTMTFGFRLKSPDQKIESVITLRGRLLEGRMDSNSDLKSLFYMDDIISSQVTSAGTYINLDCPAGQRDHCKVTGNVTEEVDKEENIVIKFKRDTEPGIEYTANIKVHVNYWGAARAYPGGYGTCSFGGEWREHDSRNDESGQRYHYWYSLTNTPTFPTCGDVDSSTEGNTTGLKLKFVGWSSNLQARSAQKINKCRDYNPVNGTVSLGSRPDAGNTNFYSCFEMEPFVALRVSNGTISGSGWTRFEGMGMDYIQYSSNNVTLPDVTFPSSNGTAPELDGWKCSDRREKHNPGDSVAPGTTCTVIKSTTAVYRPYDKMVYVGRTMTIAVSDKQISSCSVTSGSNVSAKVESGTCIVTGISKTDTPNDVKVIIEGGEERTYKFTVKELDAGDLDFVIDAPISGTASSSTGSGDIMSGSICTRFIAGANGHKQQTHVEGAFSSAYEVVSQCGDNSEFASVCLDPGRHAPGGATYEKVEDISKGSPLGNVLQAVINILSDNPELMGAFEGYTASGRQLELRTAAQVCSRIIGIATGQFVQGSVPGYSGNDYGDYAAAAEAFNAGKSLDTVVGKVYSTCGQSCQWAKQILSEVRNASQGTDPDEEVVTLKRELDPGYPKVTLVQDPKYQVTYKGKFIVPKSVKLLGIEKCGNNDLGVTCYSASLGSAVSGESTDSYEFEVVIGTENAGTMKVPQSQEDKLKVAFQLRTSGATLKNAFVIAPTEAADKQRLLMFDMGDDNLFAYFSPVPPECLTELTALKGSGCVSEETCGHLNKALFKAAKCCNQVADERVPEYKYLLNNVCAAQCTTSTMEPICDYSSMGSAEGNEGKSDLYQIHEGAHFGDSGWEESLSALPDGSGGACVVNVVETKGAYYTDSEGVVSVVGADKFITKDDIGNPRNIPEYNGNKFCQVTCKEDFDLTMGAFGNYMGDRAIKAGFFFSIDNTDIFMGGAMSCYTTYINYEDYADIQHKLSKRIVEAYDEYASWDHAYSELKMIFDGQDTYEEQIFDNVEAELCTGVSQTYCPQKVTCDGTDPTCDPDACAVDLQWKCTSTIKINYTSKVTYTDASPRYEDDQGNGPGKFEKYTYTGGGRENNSGITTSKPDFYDKNHDLGCSVTSHKDDHWESEPSASEYEGYVSCDYNSEMKEAGKYEEYREQAWDDNVSDDRDEAQETSGGYASQMNYLSNEMHENAKHMYWCQHFAVYSLKVGDSGEAMAAASDSHTGVDKVLGVRVSPKTFAADFNPIGYYTYDENQYMVTVDKDNYLVRDDFHNRKASGQEDFGKKGSESSKTAVDIDFVNGGEQMYLYNNYGEQRYCNPDHYWLADSKEGKTYGREGNGNCQPSAPDVKKVKRVMCHAGGMVSHGVEGDGKDGPFFIPDGTAEWVDGECFTISIKYRQSHYITKSVKNSSFFVNKGFWWNGTNNIKVHGDYLSQDYYTDEGDGKRMENYSLYGYEIENAVSKYSRVYGTTLDVSSGYGLLGAYNVFPISMTTPRNLYQYTYQFANVGTYFSQATLGRLMGNPESVIAVNSRTCFYEVWEDVCLCCGDPIEFHSSVLEGTTSDEIAEQVRDEYPTQFPSSDVIEQTYNDGQNNASLNFFTTVSSLSDLSAITDTGANRKLANNWGESYFSFGSNTGLVSYAGDAAKKAIEKNSDVMYTKTPEYAFELTPQTIQDIKKYNDQRGDYEMSIEKLTNYGTYTIAPTKNCSDPAGNSCGWTEPVGSETSQTVNNTNFTHYGSKFLREVMISYATPATVQRLNSNKICNTQEVDINNYDQVKDCRWVDYIETKPYESSMGTVSKKLDGKCPEGQRYSVEKDECLTANYFRLAFK